MSDPRIPVLAAEWNRQREALLAFDPDLLNDALALTDTIDGLADAGDFIAFWCRRAREDEAMAKALRSMQADMTERYNRLESRAEKQRSIAMVLMDAIGETKIVRPDITISVNAGRQKVIVSDETQLPDHLVRIKREPNKAAILEELEQGKPVAGATLSNRQNQLTIRSK